MSIYSCPACDIFPFDTADELIDHINQAHGAAPLPAPKPAPPVQQPVLLGANGSSPAAAPQAPPAPPARRFFPATEPQKNYLRRLQAQHPGESTLNPDTASKAEASAEIDRLRVLQPPVQYSAPSPSDVPTGMHYRDGIIYDVKRSKAGRLYVLVLVLNPHGHGGHWEYRQSEPLSLLSTDTVLVRDTKAA